MPIKLENMVRYPGGSIKSPEWQAIRKRIGERSGWRCETCGAPHMTMIARGSYRGRDAYMVIETCEVFDAETGLRMGRMRCTSEFGAQKVLKIVLTVAHLNHDEFGQSRCQPGASLPAASPPPRRQTPRTQRSPHAQEPRGTD